MPEIETESILVRIFGESPFVKVVDTLMDHPNYGYTKKELAEINDRGLKRSRVKENFLPESQRNL